MTSNTEQDQAMVQAWILEEAGKLLKCESVKPQDHFLDLGGDSLMAPVLANRIEVKFGNRPRLETIFSESFGRLAELVSAARTAADTSTATT